MQLALITKRGGAIDSQLILKMQDRLKIYKNVINLYDEQQALLLDLKTSMHEHIKHIEMIESDLRQARSAFHQIRLSLNDSDKAYYSLFDVKKQPEEIIKKWKDPVTKAKSRILKLSKKDIPEIPYKKYLQNHKALGTAINL